MDVLNEILGGTDQRRDLDEFTKRYDRGAPWEGISDDEAVSRYRQVARRLPRERYEESAREAFARLTPKQRREFAEFLEQRAGARAAGRGRTARPSSARLQQPAVLARRTARLNEEQPGLLEQLLGGAQGGRGSGGAGDLLSSPIAKAVLAGVAAMAVKKFSEGRR